MNTNLKEKAKNKFKKSSFELMNNTVFAKAMQSCVRKHRDIKLVTTESGRSYLVLDLTYYTTKCLTEHLITKQMKQNRGTYEGTCLFRTFKTRFK